MIVILFNFQGQMDSHVLSHIFYLCYLYFYTLLDRFRFYYRCYNIDNIRLLYYYHLCLYLDSVINYYIDTLLGDLIRTAPSLILL